MGAPTAPPAGGGGPPPPPSQFTFPGTTSANGAISASNSSPSARRIP
jgi:hypothetical protein